MIRYGPLSPFPSDVYRPEYLLIVGEIQGPSELVFGEVGDVALLSDGTLAALDRHSPEVRVFSLDGEFIRRIGRRGEGPGEFSGDGTLAILPLPSGRLAVPDLLNQSIAVFDRNGELLATHPFPLGETLVPEWRVVFGETLIVRSSGGGTETFIARLLDGTWQDTLAVVETIEQGPTPEDPRSPLLPDHWVWAVSDGRDLVLARMTRAEVTVYRGSLPSQRISWAGEARLLTEADVETLLGIVARRLGAATGDPAIPQRVRDLMAIPERAPVLADVQFGPEGILMVQQIRPISDMDRRILSVFRAEGFGGREWNLFSRYGEYFGVLDFGGNVEVFRVKGDTIVGVREGELGVSQVFLARFPQSLLDAATRLAAENR